MLGISMNHPMELHVIPDAVLWKLMGPHGMFHGAPWRPMASHGMSHGISWKKQIVCIVDFARKCLACGSKHVFVSATSTFGYGSIPGPMGKGEDKNAIQFRQDHRPGH